MAHCAFRPHLDSPDAYALTFHRAKHSMAKEHLTGDEFFNKLTTLIQTTQQKGHGSVYLSQKRLTFDSSAPKDTDTSTSTPFADLEAPANPLPILIRATDGNSQSAKRIKTPGGKTKLSTVVAPEQLDAFFTRYAEVCKANMQSLKKRDRSKRKKDRGKKKKTGGPEEKKAVS